MAEVASYVYIFQVVYKGENSVVRKDLGELVNFLKQIEQTYNGFVDTTLTTQLLSEDEQMQQTRAAEFDKSIKQRFAE